MTGHIAVYPGSFDPMTNGHLDILRRGLAVFDHVRIAVAFNKDKPSGLFTPDERIEILREVTGEFGQTVSIDSFHGLLVEYARNLGAATIIRGLRAVADFEYEFQMAMMNRHLASDIRSGNIWYAATDGSFREFDPDTATVTGREISFGEQVGADPGAFRHFVVDPDRDLLLYSVTDGSIASIDLTTLQAASLTISSGSFDGADPGAGRIITYDDP